MPPLVTKPAVDPRGQLAICICDLDRIDHLVRSLLFGGKGFPHLDLSTPIKMNRDRMDETAVAFRCDLLTAACVCDTVRAHDKRAGDHPTRVWLKRRDAWAKLPGDAVLTRVVGGGDGVDPGKVALSERWFPTGLATAEATAPAPVSLF